MSQLVILAGGRGSRIASRAGDLPKPMMEVGGKPLLQHQLELGLEHGFDEAVLFTGYRAEAIEAFFGDGSRFGVRLRYVREEQPLGTAGGVLASRDILQDRFGVMYGDTLVNVELSRLWAHHLSTGADVTLFVHPNDHPHDSDLVEVDDAGRVVAFHPYPHPSDRDFPNLVNAALYVIEKRALAGLAVRKADFAKEIFPELLGRGAHLQAYSSPEYIKDMGTPERYDRVVADWSSGKVAARSLAQPQPGVLLDRDGTLNAYVGYVRTPDQIALAPDASAAVRELNRSTHRTAIVTNQPVVARGECTEAELQRIHNRLETLLGREGAYVDRIYHCPHHPDRGFPGERADLKILCTCRKPGTALFERAARDLNLDLARSWYVGDTTIDVRTARNAGVRSVLLRTGEAGQDAKYPDRPDFVCASLSQAVDLILRGYSRWRGRVDPLAGKLRPGQWVAVGGLAHAGKSTAASALRDALVARGVPAVVLSLDNWIRSASERNGLRLSDSYDYDALQRFLAALAGGAAPGRMPWYDRRQRLSRPDGEEVRLTGDEVVIAEGVPALDLPWLAEQAALKLYVECPDSLRKQRFVEDRLWRGMGLAAAEAVWADREAAEHPQVRAGRARVDAVVEGT